jgi:hypothetical protein
LSKYHGKAVYTEYVFPQQIVAHFLARAGFLTQTTRGGGVDARFLTLLGPGAASRYEYRRVSFEQAIEEIKILFPKRR